MNGKKAKLLRKIAESNGVPYDKVKKVFLKMNTNQKAKINELYIKP